MNISDSYHSLPEINSVMGATNDHGRVVASDDSGKSVIGNDEDRK